MCLKQDNLKDIAYKAIKQKIISCQYPPNTFLSELEISNELGVSRTPIREALNKLEQENLVKIYPKRGVMVTDIPINEIHEIFQARLLLEPNIILMYGHTIDKQCFVELKKKLTAIINGENIPPFDIDQDIHSVITKSCNNRYFISMLDNIYDQNHRLRIISSQKDHDRISQTVQEHMCIVDRMLEGNYKAASAAMCTHLENARTVAIKGLLAK